MARGSTFPADDVPSRRGRILGFLAEHDPVPVPTTALYLAVADKRALADEFADLVARGEIEPATVRRDDPHHEAAARLTGLGQAAASAPVSAYRLTDQGRAAVQ